MLMVGFLCSHVSAEHAASLQGHPQDAQEDLTCQVSHAALTEAFWPKSLGKLDIYKVPTSFQLLIRCLLMFLLDWFTLDAGW